MGCTCQRSKAINACLGTVTIGTIASLSVNLHLHVRRIGASERIERIAAASDGAGLVTADMSLLPEGFLSANFMYEAWLTLQTTDVFNRVNVTISGALAADDCVYLSFLDLFEDDEKLRDTTQTLVATT